MSEIAKNQDGCYGEESIRNGMGISISYCKDLESIRKWKENLDHQFATKMGKEKWYSSYKVRIAKVERLRFQHTFMRPQSNNGQLTMDRL